MNYNYPREIYKTKIGNLNLKIIGVDHRPPFLTKNEDFFREEINLPEYIFFEMGLEGNKFYQDLAKLMDKQDKSIYVPDSLYKGFTANDVIIGGVGLDIFVNSLRKPISRRDFLKKSCTGLAGLYLTTGVMGFREDILQNILGKNATLDNKISYDAVQDFRNILSADNLNRAGNELNFEGDGTYFIGYSHLNGLRAYINNPNMREKRKLYFHLESSLTDKIKEYKNIEGVWKIVGVI
ncbi:MAG: twin-arginine translocation signal domain-containing protein [Candidatus Pacearchaeota archaeon]|nr:twin-arginine translocation signal domain-containing protein [Candidatus Pacearchaeota archaeon]